MRNLLFFVIFGAITVSGCGGKSNPLNPSDATTGKLHLSVDGSTCAGLGAVNLFIDGTAVGTVQPGDRGVTKDVAVGQHNVSGRSVVYDYGWTPNLVTVPEAGFQYLPYCS